MYTNNNYGRRQGGRTKRKTNLSAMEVLGLRNEVYLGVHLVSNLPIMIEVKCTQTTTKVNVPNSNIAIIGDLYLSGMSLHVDLKNEHQKDMC